MFRDDNQNVYHFLVEAIKGTVYTSSIKPNQNVKNSSPVFKVICEQYAGNNKWEKELRI